MELKCITERQDFLLDSFTKAGEMASSPAVLMRLVASAYAVAEKAGTIVRKVLQSGELGIVEKTGADDLQTLADRLVQKSICASLSKSFPKITIIGEEELPAEVVEEDLIENGHSSLILQKSCPDQYASLKEEEMGAGASLGRTLWGVLGLGAFGFQLQEVPDGKRIITTTRSHSNKLVIEAVQAMEPHDVIRVGGAGNKIIQLVEGKASAYVFASLGCKKWDTCAPEAILHAVGGKLTDMHGNAYRYDANVKHMNSAGVLATLRNHEYYLKRVPQAVLQALPSD
ncbi:3 (2),5 -bisphosphate nucleotidase 1 [Labeo rohita]|uniref:3'(2'),5'-bisphosphate nucleotidase 1 n=1 Tax=Labeo rohita TaxID=84645 RepID=A0A498N514_LABRO|nr:3 (2),5 -bisphosphate nucleotidase 1 [Labeo rohita]